MTNTPAPAIATGVPAELATGPAAASSSALAAVIDQALAAQDSLAVALADLTAASSATALPAPVRALVQQILISQAPLGPTTTSTDVRTAIARSGLFLERTLAAALQSPSAPAPDLAFDLKALLLRLTAALAPAVAPPAETETGTSAQAAAQTASQATGLPGALLVRPPPPPVQRNPVRPPPPARGAPTAGQTAARSTLGAEPDEAHAHDAVAHSAHGALSRLELSQIASLHRPGEAVQWTFELPVETPEGSAVAQFEIRRDDQGAGASPNAEPTWRTRFSLDVPPSGPVHAEVVLSGGRTRVTLWAPDEAARAALADGQGDLTAALAAHSGDAAVRVLAGSPDAAGAPAGQLVDRKS